MVPEGVNGAAVRHGSPMDRRVWVLLRARIRVITNLAAASPPPYRTEAPTDQDVPLCGGQEPSLRQ